MEKRGVETRWKRVDKVKRVEIRQLASNRARAEGLVGCFSYVLSLDSRPNAIEIDFANWKLTDLLGDSGGEFRLNLAETLKSTRQSTQTKIRYYLCTCKPSINEKRKLLLSLLDSARSDGPLTPEKGRAVSEIASLLSVSGDLYLRIFRKWEASKVFENVKTPPECESPNQALGSSYKFLGCSTQDSDEVIKARYRAMAVQLHPDKHSAQVICEDEAVEKVRDFQRLQAAYEEIRLSRKTRGI